MRSFVLFFLLAALPLGADPVPYTLDRERSLVGFAVSLGADALKGNMNVQSARILLDLDGLARSEISVTLDARSAITEAGFATTAMTGAHVLDTDTFPTITFDATRIRGTLSDGEIEGRVTIRGVTRPITLKGQVFRQRGTESGERDRLSILLKGEIDRRDFGADGFAQFVGPIVTIDILARLKRDTR